MGMEIEILKEGIIDTFIDNMRPNKLEKILQLTQKVSEDVDKIKSNHESRIWNLEVSVADIKGNLKNLVEISKASMNNSSEGLLRVNNMIGEYRVKPIFSVTPSNSKQKNIVKGASGQLPRSQTTNGLYTHTRSNNQEQGSSRFVMDELEDISRKVIQKNTNLVHSYQ